MFDSDRQRAIAYAAYKELEKLLKDDGELPPGSCFQVGNESITITLGNNIRIERPAGDNGDGIVYKKATQNLYGYGVWCLLIKRLSLFNQAAHVKKIIKEVWQQALTQGVSVEEKLEEIDPELHQFVENLKKQKGPKRAEATPRLLIKDTAATVAVDFGAKRQAA